MASFTSIKPLLDAMSTDELVSAGEYISQQLEKQLSSISENMTTTSKPFPLLKLPRELRDEILSYAVQSNNTPPNSTLHDGNKTYPQAQIPPLLHTSRQLRYEASEPFFSNHTFIFWGSARFRRLAQLLAISGNVWNGFVKCVVLVPLATDDDDDDDDREDFWDVFDPVWAAGNSRARRVEMGVGKGVVWTAMRRAGFGRELRYEVVGEWEVVEDAEPVEMVIG